MQSCQAYGVSTRVAIGGVRGVVRSLRGLRRARALNEREHAFLAGEFGDSLELERLRIAGGGHPFGRMAWQPLAAVMQFADACFDGSDPEQGLQARHYPTLAHEALHVWQRVHGECSVNVSIDGLWLGAFAGRAAYQYDRSLCDPDAVLREFLSGNIERQGQMFEDLVRSNVADHSARDPKFSALARYVRGRQRSTAPG